MADDVPPIPRAERHVVEAVESILGQTFGDLVSLTVDDGTVDGSRAILEHLAIDDIEAR
ncbi:MAG: hypothetical protein ACLQGP_42665 [Isosphaeraceae bacterium]